MYYLHSSCLFYFFLFSLFHHLSSTSSKQELRLCEALFYCGNITAGFPFSGGTRPKACGHPLLELQCLRNTTFIIIANHVYDVLHIDQTSKTLRLARAELRGSFCNATFTEATLPHEIFELSPTYKSLNVFYLCDPKLSYRSSYTCPGGPISVSQTLDSCNGSFTINVPKSFVPEEKELNLTHLESALSEGFEVKLKIDENACQECSSSNGTCGFENNTQVCCNNASSSGCSRLHEPDAVELHRRCNTSFSCGDQSGLLYPFWIPGREDCGHPDFKLECNTNVAEVSISSVKFRILAANYTSRVIRLARSDYIGGCCPQHPLNAPFKENVLHFARGTEMLTIYYECPSEFPQYVSPYVGGLDCEDDEKSYYVTTNLASPLLHEIGGVLNNFSRMCKRNVSVPASGPALNTLQKNTTRDNLKKALEEGFSLGLHRECSMCMDSKGACGYNHSSNEFVCCLDQPHSCSTCKGKGLSTTAKAGIEYTFGLVGIILIAGGLFCLISQQRRRKASDVPRKLNLKALMPLKHYSYAQVKRITKSFAEVVGKGGFGTVYRGTLCDGRRVAVKVLKDSKGNGEDFINEVASMSKTSHVNIVTLLGFCAEGTKRAILYEFLENGSLEQFISTKRSSNMDWRELYGIALGVAYGLEYLHHGCRTKIVHFDIKPQNVLLDDNLCPKVSDFGLAKLCEMEESILSLLDTRGTIGYIAPEVFSRVYGRVSHKSDVYSYGMLVLEMIGARNKERDDQEVGSSTSSIYFPEWIYKDLEKRGTERFIESRISNEEEEIVRKMTLVGLWCIQTSPSDRPPMNRVVEMMEGNVDALEIPPKPVFQIPAAPLREPSTLSEDISGYTEVCSINVE